MKTLKLQLSKEEHEHLDSAIRHYYANTYKFLITQVDMEFRSWAQLFYNFPNTKLTDYLEIIEIVGVETDPEPEQR
jgi:hypothetical protein